MIRCRVELQSPAGKTQWAGGAAMPPRARKAQQQQQTTKRRCRGQRPCRRGSRMPSCWRTHGAEDTATLHAAMQRSDKAWGQRIRNFRVPLAARFAKFDGHAGSHSRAAGLSMGKSYPDAGLRLQPSNDIPSSNTKTKSCVNFPHADKPRLGCA